MDLDAERAMDYTVLMAFEQKAASRLEKSLDVFSRTS